MKSLKFLILFFLINISLYASVGEISFIKGNGVVTRDGKDIKAALGFLLDRKDIVSTLEKSVIKIKFEDNTIATIGKNSSLEIAQYIYDTNNPSNSQTDLNFFKGTFKAITGRVGKINPSKFKMRTRSASIGIRGTVVFGDQENIAFAKGAGYVTAKGVTVDVKAGEFTKTLPKKPPTPPKAIPKSLIEKTEASTEEDVQIKIESEEEHEDTQNATEESTDEGDNDETQPATEEQLEESSILDEEVSEDTVFADGTTDIVDTMEELETIVEDATNEVEAGYTFTGTLNGKHFGGYMSTSDPASNFKESVDMSLTNSMGNLHLTDSLASASDITYSYFDMPTFGSYTGHSYIGNMSFSYTDSSSSVTLNGAYKIEADNTGEFIVGDYESISGGVTFRDLWYSGASAVMSNVDQSKIYIYKEFKGIDITKNNANVITDISYSSTNGKVLYNPKTFSFTYISDDFYKSGASYRNGLVSSDGSIDMIIYEPRYESGSNIFSDGTVSGNIFGTNLQGFGVTGSSIEYDDYVNKSVYETQSFVSTGFLDTTESFLSTGTITLKGYATAINYDSSGGGQHITQFDNVAIGIDRSTGAINGGFSSVSGAATPMSVALNGTVSARSSYYIFDDLFGVQMSSSSYNDGSTYSLVTNTGMLIAVPDADANDNFQNLSNESSWGYWAAAYNNGSSQVYADSLSTWVAGVETNADIAGLISSADTTTYNFSGHVMGAVREPSSSMIDPIDMTKTNYANFQFDFGGGDGSYQAQIVFNTLNNENWNISIDGTSKANSSGFSTGIITGTGAGSTIAAGVIEGSYYGTGDIKSIGGRFDFATSSKEAVGVFKADKQ